MKNHILDITIAVESVANMTASANALTTEVNSFGIHLDDAERKHSQKLGTRNETFSREMLEFAQQRPDLIPATINIAALERDLHARDQLTPLLFQLRTLLRTVEDTHIALGVDLFNGTRAAYKVVKPIAAFSGVKDVIERIGLRFKGQGPQKKSGSTPAAPATGSIDSAAL